MSDSYDEIAAQYARALRLTFGDVEVTDRVGELLAGAELDDHTDVAHWDQGTGHADGLHADLHGDMAHWDSGEITTLPPEDDEQPRPWEVLFTQQRLMLQWTVELANRFEERLTAVEKVVAGQVRKAQEPPAEGG